MDAVDAMFAYHTVSEAQFKAIEEIRVKAAELARLIHKNVPQCRERALALTWLQGMTLWSEAAIRIPKEETKND